MSKMMEFALNIQAKLDSTYESNFNKANGAINAMDSELVGLQKTQKDIANYTKLKDSIKNTKNETQLAGQKLGLFRAELEASKNQTKLAAKSMSEARKEVMELSREFDNADNPTKEMANALKIAESNLKTLTKEHGKIKNSTKTLTTSVKTAEKRVGKLNQKWKDQAIKLRNTKQGLDRAKISTKNLTAENKKISASMDKVIQKQKTMNKLQNIKNKIMNPMVGAVAGAVSVGILVSKANESIAKSSSFNEIQTKFDQVFKSYSDSANNWADSYAHDMNMSIVQTKESMGDIQNLFTGFGMDRGDSFGLSKEIIELANDLDSFNNLTDKGVDAQKTMISALMGETESAKTLGASILESNLNVASAALGYGKYSSKMDEAMKIQIRFKAIQMQSKDAIGDVTRNLDSEVGLTRKKNALLEKQQLLIGSTLMPLQMKWLNLQIGALTFMSENFDAIVATTQVLASLAAGYGAMKIIGVITTLIQGKTKAEIFAATITKSQIAIQAAYNTVLMANPIGLVVGGLVALVGIGIVVYKNF
ncbi:hypothetical protein, partial [Psychrilyobacter sp.]|uniref:hypothetical protein n=1 Tax=Psychrilyobacter sp. TaxID=2586924 RepID=UPI00301A6A91